MYSPGHQKISISHVARPSPYPTTNVDFDDGLLFCRGAYALSFARRISSSAESGAAEEFASHCLLPANKISLLRSMLLSSSASINGSKSKVLYEILLVVAW